MMTMQHKIKEVPGLAFVVESMELMSAAGRRRMLEQPFLTGMTELEYEQTAVASLRQRLETTAYNQPLNVLRHQLMQLHDLRTTLGSLRSHVVLSEVELFEVKNLAFLCGHSRRALAELEADNLFDLPDLTEVFLLLDPDHTGIPNFYIYDSYDSRLAPLRRQMKEADDQLMGELLAKHNDIQQQVIERLCDQLHPYADKLTKALEQMAYIDFRKIQYTAGLQ